MSAATTKRVFRVWDHYGQRPTLMSADARVAGKRAVVEEYSLGQHKTSFSLLDVRFSAEDAVAAYVSQRRAYAEQCRKNAAEADALADAAEKLVKP